MHPHTLETGHTCIVDNRTDKWNGLCIQCSANFLMEANTDIDARNDVAHMLAECFTCLSHEYKFEVVDKMILNTVQRLFREVQMRNDVREAEVRNVLRWISVMNIPDRLASETAIIAVIIASISECFRNSYRLMNGAGKVNCELWVYFGILRLCLQVSASKLQDFACNASCRSDLLKTMRRGFFGADGRTEGLLGVLQCLLRRDSSDLTVALCDVAMRVEGVAVVVQVLASDTGLSSISAPRCSATCLELVDSLLRELASDHSGMLKELTAEGAGSYPADPRHLNNDTMCWYRSQLMELIGILISLAEAQQVGEYFTAQRLSKQRLHLLASSAVALLSHQLDALEKNHKANTAHSAPQISNRSCDAGLRCLLRLMALTSSSAAGSEFSRSATPVATQLLADDCNYSSKLFALYERYACIGSTADPESVVVESLHALTAACPGRFFHYSLFSQRMQQVLLQQFLTSVTEAVVLSVVSDWKPELGADGLSRKSTTPVGEGERLQHLHLQGILVLAIRRRALTGSSLQDLVAGCGKLISSRFQICSTQHYYSGAVSTLAILNGVLPLLHEVVAGAIPQASVRTKTISKHLCAQPVADATQQLNHTLHLVVLEALKLLVLVLQTVDADGVLRTNLRGSVHSVVLYSMRCCTALSSRNYVSTGITASMEDTLAAQRDCAHLLSYALRLLGDKGENLSGDEVDACRTKNALFAAVVDLQQLDCLGMGELSRRGFDCRFLHHHMAVYAARQHFLHRRGRGSVSFSGIDVPNTDADYTKHIAALTMGSLNLNSKNSTSRSAIQSVDVFSFLDKTATASGRSEPSEIARLCIQAIGSPHLPLHVLQQSALLYLAACLDPSGAALSCFGFVVCPGPVLAEGGEGTEVEAAGQRQHSTALLALALAQLHDPPLICRLYQNVVRWVLDVASPQAHDLNPALCAVLLTFAVLCGGAICSSSSSICSLVRGTDAHILREYWSCCLSPTATEVSAVSDTKFTEHSLCWDSTTQEQGTQKSFTCPEEELLPVLLDRCAHMLLLSGAADANLQVAKFVLEVVRAVPTAAFSEHTSTALVSASLMLMQASAESCSTAASSVWWQALLVATARMLTTTHYTHQMNLRSEKHQGQEDERTAAADTASRTVLKTLSMLMLMSDNAPCVSVSWLTSLEQDQPTAEALRQLALSQCASDCCSAMRAWVTTGTNCSLRSQLSHCMRCNREWCAMDAQHSGEFNSSCSVASILHHLLTLIVSSSDGTLCWGESGAQSSMSILSAGLSHQLESSEDTAATTETEGEKSLFQAVTTVPSALWKYQCSISSSSSSSRSSSSSSTAANTGDLLRLLRRVNLFSACTLAAAWLLLSDDYIQIRDADASQAGLLQRCWLLRSQELQLASDVALGCLSVSSAAATVSCERGTAVAGAGAAPDTMHAEIRANILELHRCCTLYSAASRVLQTLSLPLTAQSGSATSHPLPPCQPWLLLTAQQRYNPLYGDECLAALSGAVSSCGDVDENAPGHPLREAMLALLVDRLLSVQEQEVRSRFLLDHFASSM